MKVLVRPVSVQHVQNERVAVPEKYGCAHLAPINDAPSRRLAASALKDVDVAAILAPHLHSPARAALANDGAAPSRRLPSWSDVDATVADAVEAPGAGVAATRGRRGRTLEQTMPVLDGRDDFGAYASVYGSDGKVRPGM